MNQKIFMFLGSIKALAILIILPVCMFAFGGFAPMLDFKGPSKWDHNIEEKADKILKDRAKNNRQDDNQEDNNSSDSSGPNQPNEPDNSGNPN